MLLTIFSVPMMRTTRLLCRLMSASEVDFKSKKSLDPLRFPEVSRPKSGSQFSSRRRRLYTILSSKRTLRYRPQATVPSKKLGCQVSYLSAAFEAIHEEPNGSHDD